MSKQTVLVTDTLADSGLDYLRKQEDVELIYSPGLKGAELLVLRRSPVLRPEIDLQQ